MSESNGHSGNPYNQSGQENPDHDFPMRQSIADYSGQTREFVISYERISLGFCVQAEEAGKGHQGYFFREYNATSPYLALGRILDRIRKALATRYLTQSSLNDFQLSHDTARGRISYSAGQVAFVIDGQVLSLEQFGKMIESYEGFEFRLEILDRPD